MKNFTETTTTNQPMCENQKETYVKPESQVIKMELEQPILGASGESEAQSYPAGKSWNF